MHKVGIVARGPTSELAPYGDSSWELWGLPWVRYPRINAVWEVHTQTCRDASPPMHEGPDNPEAVVYAPRCRWHAYQGQDLRDLPIDEIYEHHGDRARGTLENTICYQLAYALVNPPDVLGLWGVCMRVRQEYLWERLAVLYWIGVAEGFGVKVEIAPGSALIASKWAQGRYGVDGIERKAIA